MLRVPAKKIEPGMVLARPISIRCGRERVTLHRNDKVPVELAPKLAQMGVQEVWIRHPRLEFLDGMFDGELAEEQRVLYGQIRQNFERVMHGVAPQMDLTHFNASLRDLFDYLKRHKTGAVMLQKVDDYDGYLLTHSTNVCFLAIVLGFRLRDYIRQQQASDTEDDASHLQLLGLGCLLHDIGKTQIPPKILDKPARLTDQEMTQVRRHPIHGYKIVQGHVPATVADIVLNHHQRWNGEGYPERTDPRTGESLPRLAGERISIYSRIATVVDIYDAATSERCYSGAKPSVQVLHEMRTWCRGFFDPRVEQAFYELIPPFPIGQVVTLSDGSEAVVVDFDPDAPARPRIQILRDLHGREPSNPAREEIDLANDDRSIVQLDELDIRPFLASPPPPLDVPCETVEVAAVPNPV
ncbi:MAG: HD-GYP domain-containing protein [Pirellulales bacterium]